MAAGPQGPSPGNGGQTGGNGSGAGGGGGHPGNGGGTLKPPIPGQHAHYVPTEAVGGAVLGPYALPPQPTASSSAANNEAFTTSFTCKHYYSLSLARSCKSKILSGNCGN